MIFQIEKYKLANSDTPNADGNNYYGYTDAQQHYLLLREVTAGNVRTYTYSKGTSDYSTAWAARTTETYAIYNGSH